MKSGKVSVSSRTKSPTSRSRTPTSRLQSAFLCLLMVKRQDRRPTFSDRVGMLFSSFTCNVQGQFRSASESWRLPVCARNSSGTLPVQSSRSMRSCASMSSAVAEKRRVLGGYRCGRSAMSRQTSASHSGPTGECVRFG